MSDITFCCDDVSFSWEDESQIQQWFDQIAQNENRILASLCFIYCSDNSLLQMNQEHLNHDYYTDIITFDLSDNQGIEGEIYISIDRVFENAQKYGEPLEKELCRVMAHGLLHLIGYDDHDDKDITIMRAKETFCLSLLSKVPRGTFQKK